MYPPQCRDCRRWYRETRCTIQSNFHSGSVPEVLMKSTILGVISYFWFKKSNKINLFHAWEFEVLVWHFRSIRLFPFLSIKCPSLVSEHTQTRQIITLPSDASKLNPFEKCWCKFKYSIWTSANVSPVLELFNAESSGSSAEINHICSHNLQRIGIFEGDT